MTARAIQITRHDRDQLMRLIAETRSRTDLAEWDGRLVQSLERKLLEAQVVSWDQVSARVSTMNSLLAIEEADTRRRTIVKLVFPETANLENGRVSILTDLGIALLGAEVGDVVLTHEPEGSLRFRLVALLYQPEGSLRRNRFIHSEGNGLCTSGELI